ncbi:DUF1450 domain-containing protein [Alicyclobacillus sp. SO9]|nr:DUF1450 domain-containing protein [Alicyclobacillus sp. SO9]QQE81215.1 DUF1450 domain-containing protein [Alicyclobacillus sp. SO9]
MGIVIVEFCEGNVAALLLLEELLETEFPEVAVLQSDCLGRCGLCRVRPFVLVNDKQIFAENTDELLDKVKAVIAQELQFYSN